MKLTTFTLLSQENEVVLVDVISEKVEKVNKRISPIQDNYIEKYFKEKDLNLTATLDGASAYKDTSFVIIAAPTNYDPVKISGVAIGTCISTLYRLIASVFYLRKNIVNRSITKFFVQIFVDFVTIVIFIFVDSLFEIRFDSFLFWFVDSMIVFAINLAIGTLVFLLFKWKIIVSFLKRGEEK